MKKVYILLLLLIFAVGFLLRFYDLGKVPGSLNWDEVSWGYNAYSILQTGHDEHGVFMPLSFEAFGDFKQPVYVYLTSASIALFGLNSFAVRFPSAFLGTLTVLSVWLLVFSLFKDDKKRYLLSILAMFMFGISPWSIQFSRVAFEANMGAFFVITGIGMFLWGMNSGKKVFTYLGIITLSISCYTYHSNKVITPLLFIALLVYSKFLYKIPKKLIAVFFIVFILANIFWLIDPRTTARGRSVTFTSNQTPILKSSVQEIEHDRSNNDLAGTFFHNRRIVYLNYYLQNYLLHFSPNFLFTTGDNARHHTFGMGILYLVSLPLIIIGIIKLDKKKYWIVWFWLLIAPAASALAVDAPNASRSLVILPTWQMLEALGILYIFSINSRITRRIILGVCTFLLFGNFLYFAHNYFKHTNGEYGIYWQDGYKEAMMEANMLSKEGRKVVISDKYEQPYIFYLFYTGYDPLKYLKNGGTQKNKPCQKIDNVYFGKCTDKLEKGEVFVSMGDISDPRFKKIGNTYNSDGKPYGGIYEYL